MAERIDPEVQKWVVIILGSMIAVGALIVIAQQLFPLFLVLSILFFVVFIITLLIEIFFRDHEYCDFWDYISPYIGIALLLVLAGLFLTYFIGYGIGGTSFGVACTQVYSAFSGMQEQMEQAINQVVEESCKTLPQDSCELLRTTAKTAKTLQEVTDMADKLKKAADITNSLSK